MYEQKYINELGEDYLQKIINGKIDYKASINKTSSKDQRYYLALQHYLVKLLTNGVDINKCKPFLMKMYNDFYNNPHLFYYSPLLKTRVIELAFDDPRVKSAIINFRNSYYNQEITKKLYIAKNSTELSIEDKNRYYSNLLRKLKNPSKRMKEIHEEEIKRIINTNYQELSDIEILFYSQYVSNFAIEGKKYNTIVTLGEESPNLRGNHLCDHIFLNKNAFTSITMLTKTICHETRHSTQFHESYEKESKAGFELATIDLFMRYLNTDRYNSYHRNYQYSSIEIDAEMIGHWNAGVFFTMFERTDLSEKIREHRKESTDKRNYYNYMVDENGKAVPTDTFIVENMDKIIIDNPHELSNYPLLKQIYNNDGNKKPFLELLSQKVNENIENRGMFDNYITYGILNNELDNLELNKFTKTDLQNYAKTLGSFYRRHMLTIKSYFKDNQTKYKSIQINKVTSYELRIVYKILKNINDNFDLLINSFDSESINNRNPLFDFIYELRDFKINDIKNSTIKNNQDIIDRINYQKQICANITYKYNAAYIDSKLKKLPPEILNSEIDTPDAGTVIFKEYFTNYLLPNLDGHSEVTIGNKKYYVGDLIIGFSKIVNNNLKKSSTSINKSR